MKEHSSVLARAVSGFKSKSDIHSSAHIQTRSYDKVFKFDGAHESIGTLVGSFTGNISNRVFTDDVQACIPELIAIDPDLVHQEERKKRKLRTSRL